MARNLVTYFIDSGELATRELEAPEADWDGGMNLGASNAPAIGINTGNYAPAAQDWARQDARIQDSQLIGGTPSGVFVIDATFGDDALAIWAQTTGSVAPNGVIANVSGFDSINRTGKTIPATTWTWGVANNP